MDIQLLSVSFLSFNIAIHRYFPQFFTTLQNSLSLNTSRGPLGRKRRDLSVLGKPALSGASCGILFILQKNVHDFKLCCWKALQGNLESVCFLKVLEPRSQCPAGLGCHLPQNQTRPAENLAMDFSPRASWSHKGVWKAAGHSEPCASGLTAQCPAERPGTISRWPGEACSLLHHANHSQSRRAQ